MTREAEGEIFVGDIFLGFSDNFKDPVFLYSMPELVLGYN